MIKYLIHPLLFLSVVLVVACGGSQKGSAPASASQESVAVQLPRFDADSAYAFVEAQVNFGPRVPNSDEHRACGDYLESMLKGYGAEVVSQTMELVAYDGTKLQARNIVGQFQPEKKKRVMLCAHWDSRPWADSDPDASKHRTPILGANDGASGVGVLLEIARLFSTFLGDFIEYEVELDNGQSLIVNEYTKDTSDVHADGERVFLSFDPERISLYEAQSEEVLSL